MFIILKDCLINFTLCKSITVDNDGLSIIFEFGDYTKHVHFVNEDNLIRAFGVIKNAFDTEYPSCYIDID